MPAIKALIRYSNVAGAARSYGVIVLNSMVVARYVGIQSQRTALTSKPQHGFTLLELTVVLFVVVLGFSVIGLNLSSGNDSTEVKAAARDIVSALRYARGQALTTHQEATVTVNLSDNSYTVSGRDKLYQIPKAIDVTVVTAQTELTGEGTASIRFFADGSSTGGRITLELGQVSWKTDINWLTGQIELESK
ncbi:MAG TPA: GspH/FimT family protein [Methylobacter sp.]|jgi:general secretion pathway protein H